MGRTLLAQIAGTTPEGAAQTMIVDYTDIAEKVEITTNRLDTPGKMTFTCIEPGGIGIPEGSAVEFVVDGFKMFKGYVFTIERNRNGETAYTAYDQLRYLKTNASYTFENMSLSQIIQRIASDFGLAAGRLADTGYIFPYLPEEDTGCLDIIFEALSQTIIQTGKIFLFYDNAGELTLIEAKDLFIQTLIGDGSLAIDYTYKRDIDAETYNRIKLVKKNEQTGRTDVYIHEDSEAIKKWGILQYYSQIDENLNEAQIDQMCQLYLQYYNRVLQTITIEAIGVPQIRAGCIIPVQIKDIGDLAVSRLLMAEKVTHSFDGDAHTMSIEVKSFEQLGGAAIV
ncbi:MAG TPA: hypothetical protein DDY31_17715 [Lachnospiraceae bacterium]|nr:hypothetical protein [Lachnospiraceae bacterium]